MRRHNRRCRRGAARNFPRRAFWGIDAQRTCRNVAELAGLGPGLGPGLGKVPPLLTAFTVAFDTPDKMAELPAANRTRPLLKWELGGAQPPGPQGPIC